MKTFFLTAKSIALHNNEDTITPEHLKKALETLEFTDKKAKKIICNYLQITPPVNLLSKISQKDIDDASKTPKLLFSLEVKRLKEFLQMQGFPIEKKVCKLFIEKQKKLKYLKKAITHFEKSLKSQIFGQDEAVEALCDKIVESFYNNSPSAPRAIFFFLGPPATGKTMLSYLISKNLGGYESFKIFDMTLYTSANEGFGLFGLTKGYTDAQEGKLTSFVKTNPKSILVFDEIEKAHPGVLSNFLMMLSSGFAEDGYTGERIDFRRCIIVFTSNIGSELYNNQDFVEMLKNNPLQAQSTILEAISREEKIVDGLKVKALSSELLSRLSQGQIVLFNKLPFDALLEVAQNTVSKVQKSFETEFGLDVSYDSFSYVISLLVLSFAPNIDIRKLKSKLPLVLFDIVTDYIRKNDLTLEKIIFSLDDKSKQFLSKELFLLDTDAKRKLIHELFRKNETFTHEIDIKYINNTLIVKFKEIKRTKLLRSIDFFGDGGLVFEIPEIDFHDIAGHKIAKNRLREVINILKNPGKLKKFDLSIPKGILLYGVSGTGKTMLAKAFAHEADLPFIETTGSEILDIEFMKSIFKKAKEYAPSIIFIDEIDAIGSRNGTNIDISINQFLTELNGFSDDIDNQVFIIAATNLKDKIDPALLRSGRIDLHIKIDTLDREAREFFIDKILKKPTKGIFDKEKILTYTAGMTGADLEKVSRESSLYVFRNNLDAITQEILIEQINIIKYGTRIIHTSIDKLIRSTAIHEAGHAIISKLLMPEVKIEQITVTPRSNSLGFVAYTQESDYANLTKQDIKNKLCIAFAGRQAQIKAFGEDGLDSGATNDLDIATKYAHYAITTFGMGEKTGYVNLSTLQNEKLFSKEIESDLKDWLDKAQKNSTKLIDEYWSKIIALANLLQSKEVVDESELLRIIKQ